MNGANIIIYLLLIFFICGTSYLTYITAKEVAGEVRQQLKAFVRLPRVRSAIRNIKNTVEQFSSTLGIAVQK